MSKLITVITAVLVGSPLVAQANSAKRVKPEIPAPRPEYNIHNLKPIGGSESSTYNFDRSIIRETPIAGSQAYTSSASTPPPPSPGLAIGQTPYELQHNTSQGYQVARISGADIVHFVWTDYGGSWHWEQDRYVAYNTYTVSTNTLNQGFGGAFIGLGVLARSGFSNIAVDGENRAHVALHQRQDPSLPIEPWHLYFPTPGNVLHQDSLLTGYPQEVCDEVLWPRVAASRDAANTAHVIAHTNFNLCDTSVLWYWRFNGSSWTGPVAIDSTPTTGYVLADDPTSDKVAIVVHVDNHASMFGLNNVAYLESNTDGAGWIAGTEPMQKSVITSYADPLGPQAWLHLSTVYDNSGTLHIVWDEQRYANDSGQASIKHWNSARQTIRTVAEGFWPTPLSCGNTNLNLAKITLGIGDGSTLCSGQSNENYLYVLYTRFSGTTPAEQADHSVHGFYNGELHLNVSANGGLSWSPSRNLTNSKTPNCNPGIADTTTGIPQRPDSVCRAEHWATIGMIVSDIDIFFISDKEAGTQQYSEPFEYWGPGHLNPVHYLRLPGGTPDAPYVCPNLGPQYSSSFSLASGPCGTEVTSGDSALTSLVIGNFGNRALSGLVSVVYTDPISPPAQWLTIAGAQSVPISIPVGGVDLGMTVKLSSTGLQHGMYDAEIHIVHNDTTQGGTETFPVALGVAPCACQGDPACDASVDVLDVVTVINRAFRGFDVEIDPACPFGPPQIDGTTDVDCSGATDVVDVVKMVDVAFRGVEAASTFCRPCAM